MTIRRLFAVLVLILLVTVACADRVGREAVEAARPALDEPPEEANAVEKSDPSLLKRPFTADQIRDEWVEGFRVLMRRSTADGTAIERWTVVTADDDGAEIEFATLDEDGSVVGEPTVQRATWTELRDHASFPAATASRRWTTRTTALGTHSGWLYTVPDEDGSTVQEFFFVPTLPGAPVHMRIVTTDATVFELEQIERDRPEEAE